MAIFEYYATDHQGQQLNGLVEADNLDIAFDILKDKSYNVISIHEQRENVLFKANIMERVKIKDVVIFSRQFSVLISANITLVQALKILVEQTENNKLKMILAEVAEEIDGGSRLSDALEKRLNIFSQFYVSVIRSGETSGKLDEVLNYLAEEMEKDYDMNNKIRGAMIYPLFIMSSLIGVGVLMMIFVIPKLTAVLTESGVELPFATRVLMGTSAFLTRFWYIALALLIGAFIGLKLLLKTVSGKYAVDWIKLRIPIFGGLLKRIYILRFTRSMQTLIAGGVSITNSLKIVSDIVGNTIYRDIILQTIDEVEEGNSISSIFVTRKEIPKMLSEMMSIGEKTGKLDHILGQISNFYGREVDTMVSNLMTLMEPIIMLVMGGAVGIMVAAVIMPMYGLANAV